MKVSIVTPSYNQGAFIQQTIDSVLSQDYPDIEYLVIDGGSTDGTLDILKKHENQLTWISEPDNGQSDAINKGFRMATGEVVAWLNSDDVYEPGAVSAIVSLFENNPKIGLVYGEGYVINESGEKQERFSATTQFDLWKLIHVWDFILQPTTFFRHEALRKCGYLNEDLHYIMDWDLWIRLALFSGYDVKYCDRYLACTREYASTKTSTGGFTRVNEIMGMMHFYVGELFTEGCLLYYYDWISKLNGNSDVLDSSIAFLQSLPIADDHGYCPPITNLCVNKSITKQPFDLVYEDDVKVEVNIFVNDYFYERVMLTQPEQRSFEIEFEEFPTHKHFHLIQLEYPNTGDETRPRIRVHLE